MNRRRNPIGRDTSAKLQWHRQTNLVAAASGDTDAGQFSTHIEQRRIRYVSAGVNERLQHRGSVQGALRNRLVHPRRESQVPAACHDEVWIAVGGNDGRISVLGEQLGQILSRQRHMNEFK